MTKDKENHKRLFFPSLAFLVDRQSLQFSGVNVNKPVLNHMKAEGEGLVNKSHYLPHRWVNISHFPVLVFFITSPAAFGPGPVIWFSSALAPQAIPLRFLGSF